MKPQKRSAAFTIFVVLLLGLLSSSIVSAQQATFAAPKLIVNTSFLNVRTGPGVEYSVLVTVVGGTELPVLGAARDRVWYQVATDGGPGWVNITFTLARGDFTFVPLAEAPVIAPATAGQGGGSVPSSAATVQIGSGQRVTGATVVGGDLRSEPRFDAFIIRSAVPPQPNQILPLLGQTRDANGVVWSQVNIPGVGTGWLDRIELRPLACGTDTVGVVLGETPLTFDGIANREPIVLATNTEGYIVGREGERVRFQLTDGTVGFVGAGAVATRPADILSVCDNVPSVVVSPGAGGGAPESTDNTATTTVASAATNVVIINTGFLNIRSGPAAGFSVVATLPGGTQLVVLGRAPDGVWYFVEGAFGTGWLNSQFTIFRGNYGAVPTVDSSVAGSANTASLGQGGGSAPSSVASGRQVTGATVVGGDLRSEPNFNSLVIRSAVPPQPNQILPLLGQSRDASGILWSQVNIPGIGAGWLDRIELRPLACGSDSVGVVLGDTPMTFDGIASREPIVLPINTEAYIVGREGERTILELTDGTVGKVGAESVVTRSADIVSVCEGVSAVSGIPAAPAAQPEDAAAPAPAAAASGNVVIVNTGNLNIRSGPAAGFSVVSTVPGGTELVVVGRAPDGVWYLVQGSFGQGWINNQFVLFRGNYGTVPVVQF